ncbi:hypothetical protein AB833_27460 [Chromatiales bacterium (ex Bugula neritina AB1)]|nr:hypothetical protein AB833_27460 [Chromatiales bacterium (ex Bugula neritina AB1)]
MLQLDSLHFRHTRDTRLYQFSLSVPRGSIAAVCGKSGSGKSTLLDLIAGFLLPISGNIYWDDKPITSLAPDKRPVTTVFQKNNLFEHRNALDNVVVGIDPAIPSSGSSVEKARQALASVGLQGFENQQVSTLSGGQQQRVSIARALLRPSEVILLDEPFSALDNETKAEIRSLIRQLADGASRAIVMVTHDDDDTKAIADSRYRLEHGKLI